MRILLNQQNREAVAAEADNEFEQPLDQEGRQSQRGFIEHHQLRLGQQCPTDREHLLLAA